MVRKRCWSLVALLAAAVGPGVTGCAGDGTPVRWTATLDRAGTVAPGSTVRVLVDTDMDRGWYFYSVTQPAGGPIPARIWLSDTTLVRSAGSVSGPAPVRRFDRTFKMDVEKYLEAPTFVLPVRIPGDAPPGAAKVRVSATYQACNDSICLSPATVTMSVPVTIASN